MVSPSVVAPGHRGRLSLAAEAAVVGRVLRRASEADATILTTVPWQWPAAAATPARRHVHDCADDWAALIPGSAGRIDDLTRRVVREADEILVVNERLGRLFAGRSTVLVPNGVDPALLDAPPSGAPESRTMAYVGTISERVDLPLLAGVLRELPDWRLDLWGQCRFAGRGERPSQHLTDLLEAAGGRVVWRGVVPRDRLASVLDRAEVLIVPFVPGQADGNVMKLFDYAARGRPIVASRFQEGLGDSGPPGLVLADGATEFAVAVARAGAEPDLASARRRWAAEQTWQTRWPRWRRALFGDEGGSSRP